MHESVRHLTKIVASWRMVSVPQNANRSEVEDKFPSRGDDIPCYVCGRPCKPNTKRWLRVIDGGFAAVHPEDEAVYERYGDRRGDLGMQPIGHSCLKKHPMLKEYATK